MEPRHHLCCLGQPVLFSPHGEPIRFRTKKHLALLVYLSMESGRAHRRDRLAEFLWPKAEIAEGRHSLATALSILRPRLGPDALETTRDHVTLHRQRLTLDLDRLLTTDILGSETTGLLDVAGFLDGFDIPDSSEFALWKDRQQARLLPMIKNALVLLIDRCRRTGESRQIEQLADRMLILDDLSEEGIRAKMEARAMAGDRLTALKLFEEWKANLWTELRAIPSRPVEQMAVTMRRGGWERTAIADIPVSPPERGRERVFVGRAREYGLLYECWESLKKGKAVHSMVLGDSGVGKTTLVERLTTAAGLEGASVARVQSYDLERNIPFATLGGLILGLLDRPGASATPAEALAELARTVPDVRRRFPGLPLASDSQGESARIRLTESFHELLKAIAEEHTVILVVDDLHLADEASLAVLHLVLRRAASEAIMAVFTARSGELNYASQAAILRESIKALGGQEITVGPLDEMKSIELLRSLLLEEDLKPTSIEQCALVKASGGFPMVLELLVQDWRTNGSSSAALALDAMTGEFVSGVGPVAAYGKILSRLTGTLEPATRSALDLASVLGHRLNDLSMYSVIDLSLGQTMAALGQLSEVRVLRDGDKGLEFTNELIRAHAYAAVPSSARKALHAAVADRFMHGKEPPESTSGLEIAWHCMRAGRVRESIPHLFSGASSAMRSGAPQSADRALASALPSLHDDDLLKGTILLVEALQEQGRWRESLNALETLNDFSVGAKTPEAFALAALARAYLGTPMGEWLELLPTLKEILQSCTHTLSRVRAAKAVAHATSGLRDRLLAREMLELVDQIPTLELDSDAQAQVALIRALFLFQAGEMEASYDLANSHLEQLRGRGHANALFVHLQTGLGSIRGRQGRYEEAAGHHERGLRFARLLGNDTLTSHICANLALCYGRLGRYEDQLVCAESSPTPTDAETMTFTEVHLACSVAYSHGIQGRTGDMREAIRQCDNRIGPHVPGSVAQSWLLWKADVLAVAGLRAEALETALEAVRGYQLKLECSALAGVFARWAAVTCMGTDDEERVRVFLGELDARLSDYDALDQVDILCAIVHCGLGRSAEHLEKIASRSRSLPGPALAPVRAMGLASFGQAFV
jgi:DNA-binding SARP family transcriptional activator/tetratricopeptide (TPR) repeat protein